MAAKKKPDHAAFLKMKADLQAGALGTVYIFCGEESYLREYYVTVFKKALTGGAEAFNFHKMEGKGLTVQLLTETVEAMPIMADRTMVQVVDWDLFKLSEEQRNAFISLLEDFPPYCCLVLVYDQMEYSPNKKFKKLYAALEKYSQTVKFEQQSKNELLKWIAKRFRAGGHTIDAPTAEHLLFTCGSLMNSLIPEIEKISAFAKEERITKADIDAVAAPVLEAQVFDLTKAVAQGNYNQAAAVLGSLLKMQEEPFLLLALLGKELRRLYTARIALDCGKNMSWLMEQWNIRYDFVARQLLDNAKKVSQTWCENAVRRCFEVDLRIKSVNGVNGAEELKLLLMELAQGVQA